MQDDHIISIEEKKLEIQETESELQQIDLQIDKQHVILQDIKEENEILRSKFADNLRANMTFNK